MAVQSGPLVALTDAKLEFSDDAWVSTFSLDLAVSYDFESTLDTVETTNFDDVGKKTYGAGNLDATIGGTVLFDPSDSTGYDNLWAFHVAKTLIAFRYFPTTVAGDPTWYGNCYITKIGQPSRQGERLEVPFEMQVTAGITKQAQPYV
jgi:hypothetical protein